MHPPASVPPPVPGSGGDASPARAAAALARELARQGMTGICTAAAETVAVISVIADLTVWTDGRVLWWAHRGQRHTRPATDPGAAAAPARLPHPPRGRFLSQGPASAPVRRTRRDHRADHLVRPPAAVTWHPARPITQPRCLRRGLGLQDGPGPHPALPPYPG
jgi:hypothetical protein